MKALSSSCRQFFKTILFSGTLLSAVYSTAIVLVVGFGVNCISWKMTAWRISTVKLGERKDDVIHRIGAPDEIHVGGGEVLHYRTWFLSCGFANISTSENGFVTDVSIEEW